MSIAQPVGNASILSRLATWLSLPLLSETITVAFRDFQHVWICKIDVKSARNLWSKPNDLNTPDMLLKLSKDGGHDVSFCTDGTEIF